MYVAHRISAQLLFITIHNSIFRMLEMDRYTQERKGYRQIAGEGWSVLICFRRRQTRLNFLFFMNIITKS